MDIEDFNMDWEERDHLVAQDLYRLHAKRPKDLRCKAFQVNGAEWTSWTMRDHLYKKSFYPTQARGLFTTCDADGRYRIKVRGYDKFFNINETGVTQWSSLEKDTEGPYSITAKENGCIIFIAASSATSLVATSKHMVPEPKDDPSSHGGVGYNWLLKHLKSVGQAPEVLATWLWTYRVTLVAELCDDEFEEHVVPYRTNDKRGLYLHGINYNTMVLHTLPIDIVHQVADKFGLHTVASLSLGNDMVALRRLADDIQKNSTGKLDWMGGGNYDESEGIVIRCYRGSNGNDFFFKVKDNAYLLHREYREVTKALVEVVAGGKRYHGTDIDKEKLKVRIKTAYRKCNGGMTKKLRIRFEKTLSYIHWLEERIIDHPEWFLQFSNNKGIVNVRMSFEQDWQDGNVPVDLKTTDLDIGIEWDTRW